MAAIRKQPSLRSIATASAPAAIDRRFRQRLRSAASSRPNSPVPTACCSKCPACRRPRRWARRCSTIQFEIKQAATRRRSQARRPPLRHAAAGCERAAAKTFRCPSIAKDIAAKDRGRPPRTLYPMPRWRRPRRCSQLSTAKRRRSRSTSSRRFSQALAHFWRATIADCGFAERLVVFWSNHFCVSANKGPLARMWAGAFEREAIRPHVLGGTSPYAAGGRAASGDAVLSRQPAIARSDSARGSTAIAA